METIGELVKQARIEARLSQQELADHCGRRQAAISDIENDKMQPDYKTLGLIAQATKKPIDYFYPQILHSLTADEFQRACLRTWIVEGIGADMRVLNAAVGSASEVGEAINHVKKEIFFKIPLDRNQLISEIGDALYYLAMLAWEYEISLGAAMEGNIEKLNFRYPDGYVNGGGRRGVVTAFSEEAHRKMTEIFADLEGGQS